jgi:respiratory burst oxidase
MGRSSDVHPRDALVSVPDHMIDMLSHSASRKLRESQHSQPSKMNDNHQSKDNDELVEITLDLGENGVSLRHVNSVSASTIARSLSAEEASLVVDYLERESGHSLHSSSLSRSASQRLRQLSTDLGRLSRNGSRLLSARFSHNIKGEDDTRGDDIESNASAAQNESIQLQRTVSSAEHALEGLKIIKDITTTADQQRQWEGVKAKFHTLKNEEGVLQKCDFAECIDMANCKEFAGELFDALTRKAGKKVRAITEEDLYEYWMQISDQSFDGRMQIFFALCDRNGDGKISGIEIKEVLKVSAAANKLSQLKDQAEEYAALIMEELDTERQGFVELWQLEVLLRAPNGAFDKETYRQHSHNVTALSKNRFEVVSYAIRHFFCDHWKKMWIILLWVGAMAGLSVWKFLQYEKRAAFGAMGYCLPVAKSAAETLKLNMALILLPMCRITLTYLRSTFLRYIVPFDDSLNFHMLIAYTIALGILIHAGLHLGCDFPRVVDASKSKFMSTVASDLSYSQPKYWWFLTSVEGITGIAMIILMATAFIFASKWFRRSLIKLPWPFQRLTGYNVFWYTHRLFIIVYVVLIVHSQYLIFSHKFWQKSTWMYLAIPLLLYVGEQVIRFARTGNYQVEVVKAAIYPGNVLSLHFARPEKFVYKSGMYMFVNCPELSPFEWHPFSITSAPDDAYLSVHIRTLGDWTKKLRTLFQDASGDRKKLQIHNDWGLSGELVQEVQFPKVKIDGPYGAPAQDYAHYDVLLLVGLGIGATPFISILKDMLNNIKEESLSLTFEKSVSDISLSETPRRRKRSSTKAYFYWVTREQGSFDWFRGIMREVEENDQQHLIEMHNYLTSVYEEGDTRSALIMLVQALHHAKNGVDFVSGTRARTHFARPNWNQVFSELAATHAGKRVGVFYCGPAVLAKELSSLCRSYNRKSAIRFDFHKENF